LTQDFSPGAKKKKTKIGQAIAAARKERMKSPNKGSDEGNSPKSARK